MKRIVRNKILVYAALMLFSFIIEWNITYHSGIVSMFLYLITPLRFLLCRYMVRYLDKMVKEEKKKELSKCSIAFSVLSVVFVLDFIGNLIYTVPFPRTFLYQTYGFFIGISILEFVLSSFCILLYHMSSQVFSAWWIILNVAITIGLVTVFVQSFGGNYVSEFWLKVACLGFVFREIMLFWKSLKEMAEYAV